MKKISSNAAGFTLVEIMIVVAIIGLLAAIAIPNFVKARSTSQQKACINNLRQIDGAAQTWALESKHLTSDPYTLADVTPYIKLDSQGNLPACPGNGQYAPGATVGNPPTCTLGSSVPSHVLP
jgi:general secretion pathway protein G